MRKTLIFTISVLISQVALANSATKGPSVNFATPGAGGHGGVGGGWNSNYARERDLKQYQERLREIAKQEAALAESQQNLQKRQGKYSERVLKLDRMKTDAVAKYTREREVKFPSNDELARAVSEVIFVSSSAPTSKAEDIAGGFSKLIGRIENLMDATTRYLNQEKAFPNKEAQVVYEKQEFDKYLVAMETAMKLNPEFGSPGGPSAVVAGKIAESVKAELAQMAQSKGPGASAASKAPPATEPPGAAVGGVAGGLAAALSATAKGGPTADTKPMPQVPSTDKPAGKQ